MSERPGTREARLLFTSLSEAEWIQYLNQYPEAVAAVAEAKRKPELLELDIFWNSELSGLVNSRVPQHIVLSELSKIMSWKLIRGKFRPLQKLVDGNSNAHVIESSTKAFQLIKKSDWMGATNALTSLKGIGVATASAVLAPVAPSLCPFMADEVIEAVTTGKRDYNMKVYKEMQSALVEKATTLGGEWTAEKVGRALWTRAMLHAYPSASVSNNNSNSNNSESKKKRIKSEEYESESEVVETKKRKSTK